jgi:hypothetical protein
MVSPCASCGKGPWIVDAPEVPSAAGRPTTIRAHCKGCQTSREFTFVFAHDLPADAPAETINPSPAPSEIVDLAQWMSLFYHLVEASSSQPDRPEARRLGYRAALCLAEALKFYEDDELPPDTAFFARSSLESYREHPEKFARQRLRDMQAKLPSLEQMESRLARDERGTRRRWWQFWKARP